MRTLVIVALMLFPACSATEDGGQNQLTGVVIDVDARSITDIRSFTLKNLDKTYRIFIDPTQDYEFPPSHLRAHQAGAEPLAVEVEERGDRLVATAISDA